MKILILDDEESLVKILSKTLQQMGHEVFPAHTATEGIEKHQIIQPDMLLLDIHLPDLDGMEVLEKLNQAYNACSVVIITGGGSVDSAVQAMKLGAEDYLEKPIDPGKLRLVVKRIEEKRSLLTQIETLRNSQLELYRKDYLFLNHPGMRKLYDSISQVSKQEHVSVLILGETGTGKEHVARLIHFFSSRASKPFVEIHCGALPETILESELFGYEPGAFTDARKQKPGLFETANGGSLFLDEIGELTLAVQTKLLKVLEQKSSRRLGGVKEIPFDVRIITATHRNLEKEVAEGRFRADLFYRLNVVPLEIPPLRNRPEDVVQLAQFFHKEACQAFNKNLILLSDEILAALQAYSWPGNVRELKHVMERMVVMSKDGKLTSKDLPKEVREAKFIPPSGKNTLNRKDSEIENIKNALTLTNGNRSKAAELLGITRKTLFNKMNRYGLEKDKESAE
jgi:DNA-binding NtrC family response regulator